MGIPSQVARLILREHRFRPITGKLLSIGRQIVQLTPDQAISLVEAELGIQLDVDPLSIEIDTSTRSSKGRNLISDRAFYALFSDTQYHCLDQSDYEDADFIFDLCDSRLPSNLAENFDFIYDGSTLDNIFDPAAGLRNLARMTAPGGRLFHLNRASRAHNVYVAFALSWFHDYYSLNDFDDCQVYLAHWDKDQITSRWDLYHYRPLQERDGMIKFFGQDTWYYPWRHGHTVVIAEKGIRSTWDKNPIQFEFRSNTVNTFVDEKFETLLQPPQAIERDPYARSAMRFSHSRRPPIVGVDEKVALGPELINYAPEIVYSGSIDAIIDPRARASDIDKINEAISGSSSSSHPSRDADGPVESAVSASDRGIERRLRPRSQVEMTVRERYPDWPEIPTIGNEHLADARLHANRKSMVASLPIPPGGKIAEIGVFKGAFSTFLIEELKPRQFFGFDAFAMHKRMNRRGISGAQLFEGLTHRQYYEREMAKFHDIVVPVEGLTAQSLRGYTDRSFDLVYVDAGHSYAEVRADAACAAEMVSEAGFLVFNDYILVDPESYIPYGVVPVVNDLVANQGWIIVGYALEEHLFCDIALRRA